MSFQPRFNSESQTKKLMLNHRDDVRNLLTPIVDRPCRLCAAKKASAQGFRGVPRYGVCGNCWDRFIVWHRHRYHCKPTRNQFNEWLTRAFYLAAKRLKDTGVLARCEAVTGGQCGNVQCSNAATKMRLSRPVCCVHDKIYAPTFIDQRALDPFEGLAVLMRDLARTDPRFKRALLNAAKEHLEMREAA